MKNDVARRTGFDGETWDRLMQRMDRVPFRAGDVLIEEDGRDRSLAIVVDGEVEVRRAANDIPVVRLGPGRVLGEVAFFDDRPRTASVVAVTSGAVLHMSGDEFDDLRATEPDVAVTLLLELGRALASRFRGQLG